MKKDASKLVPRANTNRAHSPSFSPLPQNSIKEKKSNMNQSQGYYIQGRQQARKLPNADTAR